MCVQDDAPVEGGDQTDEMVTREEDRQEKKDKKEKPKKEPSKKPSDQPDVEDEMPDVCAFVTLSAV